MMTVDKSDPTMKPPALSVQPEHIPDRLTDDDAWLVWRWVWKQEDQKWTKPPYRADDPTRHASSTNSATWAPFGVALTSYLRGDVDGIGRTVSPSDRLIGIDFDDCFDPETGELAPHVAEAIRDLDSYTEFSPTQAGIRVFVDGELPTWMGTGKKRPGIEVYAGGRYLTVTGHRLPGAPATVNQRPDALEAFIRHVWPNEGKATAPTEPARQNGAHDLTDDEVVAKARDARNGAKFRALWSGDTSGHGGDDSGADLALVSILAFWTQDRGQIDRLFRRSGLYRPKWDSRHSGSGATYGEMTTDKALSGRTEFYEPSPPVIIGRSHGLSPEVGQAVDDWPEPLSGLAFHGLAGDVARAFAPHTEGDPVALLVNYIWMFTNAVGSGPHTWVGETRHTAILFGVQAGKTSRARKGTASSGPKRIVGTADPTWVNSRFTGGMSSGEGLIHPIRDPVEKVKKGVPIIEDPGVTDKRLFVAETEFSMTLKVATREGNPLTEIIRKAWDGETLRTMTRNSPLSATSPHVSIMGHITKEELLRVFDATDAANGFGNRFVWFCVRRAQLLPEGGRLPEDEAAALIQWTREALKKARAAGEVRRNEEARELWHDVYPDLTADRPGLAGALLSRAEAQVLRFSLAYALIDGSNVITFDHLAAALALWDYATASVLYLFGDATGDPIADRILNALRQAGPLDQTAIVDLFGRHVRGDRIGRALETLVSAGLIVGVQEVTGGRPRTVWTANPRKS